MRVDSIHRILFVFVLLALGSGCVSERTGRRVEKSNRIVTIATDATFAPFHFLTESGEVSGFDVELARALVRRIGAMPKVEVVRPYDRLWSGLENREFDCVAATTGITPARRQKWLMTDPYFQTAQVAVVRTGDNEPGSLADMEGQRIGAAGTGTSWLAAQSIRRARPTHLGKGQAGIPTLLAGDIDALIVDEFDGVDAANKSNGALRLVPTPVALESYAVVLNRSSRELWRRLNRALESMRRDGSLAKLRKRFGLDRPDDWPVRFGHAGE